MPRLSQKRGVLKKNGIARREGGNTEGVPNTPTQGRFFLTVTADGVHILRHQRLLTAPFTPSASADSAISVYWQHHRRHPWVRGPVGPSGVFRCNIQAITVCWQRHSCLTWELQKAAVIHCHCLFLKTASNNWLCQCENGFEIIPFW